MISIPFPIDPAILTASELTFSHTVGAKIATFDFPKIEDFPQYNVSVSVNGSNLEFFPERSAGQKEVLQKLGLPA